MISITLCGGEKGELLKCKAMGHSEFAKKGSDVVCAAVSVLLRTAVLALEEKCLFDDTLKVELLCQKRGEIEIEVVQCGRLSFEYLVFLFEFLRLGFQSLVSEDPEFVKLECLINKKE